MTRAKGVRRSPDCDWRARRGLGRIGRVMSSRPTGPSGWLWTGRRSAAPRRVGRHPGICSRRSSVAFRISRSQRSPEAGGPRRHRDLRNGITVVSRHRDDRPDRTGWRRASGLRADGSSRAICGCGCPPPPSAPALVGGGYSRHAIGNHSCGNAHRGAVTRGCLRRRLGRAGAGGDIGAEHDLQRRQRHRLRGWRRQPRVESGASPSG